MVKNRYLPDRGDVVWIDLNPTRGHEQSNVRPALVLSPKAYNQKTNLMIVCAITSHAKGYPFEVLLKEKKVEGVILADQVRNLDWKMRNTRFIQKASPKLVEEVTEKLNTLLSNNRSDVHQS